MELDKNNFFQKLNWIKSRKIIFLSISIETLVFIMVSLLHTNKNLIDNNLSITKLILIYSLWVTGNYILGRYIKEKKSYLKFFINQIISSSILLFFCFSFSYLIFIIIARSNGQFVDNNFIFLVNLSLISISINFITNLVLISSMQKNRIWLYAGDEKGLENLNMEIRAQNSQIIISNFSEIDRIKNKTIKGIIYDYESEELNNLKKKYPKAKTFKIHKWIEIFIQKVPLNLREDNFYIQNLKKPKFSLQYSLKRISDIFISLLLIISLLPIFIISIILIFIEDGKPIFYNQNRTGLNKKIFKITKLRTMKNNSEINGPQWAEANDKRITKVGRILRKYRIDELPQLISVIKGDLSLIGPRPERPEIDYYLREKIVGYMNRYNIQPGLSGWAQVNYPYGASEDDAKNKLGYDLYYIKNFSSLLDLLIFFKTLKLVFNARGSSPKNIK